MSLWRIEKDKKNMIDKWKNSVKHAYDSACCNAKEEDLVFVGGSNFTVAEVV